MIQVLTYRGIGSFLSGKDVVVNSIHAPRSLDEFEINVIFLSDAEIWKNNADNTRNCNAIADLKSLSLMINNSKNTCVLFVYPQNKTYYYDCWGERYHSQCELKNMLTDMTKYILAKVYGPLQNIELMYENTKTEISGDKLSAAFYFNVDGGVLFSERSNKSTVINVKDAKDVYATTLEINSYDQLISLLRTLKLVNDKEKVPEWLDAIKMFDDKEQEAVIEKNNCIIEMAKRTIFDANSILNKNRYYKSILYTNGDELVEVVFEILEQILGCNLSDFVDDKKEDFLFNIEDHVFIGEIKGVNHNVKNENISQLDVHYQTYIDEHPETKVENITAIIIINHQKNKSLELREEVHENQIKLAERNGSIIIETLTLLKMYEKFLNNEISREQCIDIITGTVGLLIV